MFEKVVTKWGTGQSPIYSFLGTSDNPPAWNFSKNVVGKNGKIVAFVPSRINLGDPAPREAIAKALAAG
jgi:glutathione peroxidase-family protein